MKLSIIDNFPLSSPARQGIIAPMLDGIKSVVTVIAPKTTVPGALDVRSGSVPPNVGIRQSHEKMRTP
jgi:hypothetical protein